MRIKLSNKKVISIVLVLFVVLAFSFLFVVIYKISAAGCPLNTVVGDTFATLSGEVTDDGGDPDLEVWFQYGRTLSYGNETHHRSQRGIGIFCETISDLTPNTTYHYRAVARNSVGTSFGEDKTFTTRESVQPTVDLKVNNSDGQVNVSRGNNVTLSWNSTNVTFCNASGDWSGSKNTSGFETIRLNTVKTYTFTIACYESIGGRSVSDSVTVVVNPNLPTVITKPAIVTW